LKAALRKGLRLFFVLGGPKTFNYFQLIYVQKFSTKLDRQIFCTNFNNGIRAPNNKFIFNNLLLFSIVFNSSCDSFYGLPPRIIDQIAKHSHISPSSKTSELKLINQDGVLKNELAYFEGSDEINEPLKIIDLFFDG
jgi:hypothetical protein